MTFAEHSHLTAAHCTAEAGTSDRHSPCAGCQRLLDLSRWGRPEPGQALQLPPLRPQRMLGSLEPSDGWDKVSNTLDAISVTLQYRTQSADHCSAQAAVVRRMPAKQRVHQARCSCIGAFWHGEVRAARLSCTLGARFCIQHAAAWQQQQVGFISCVIAVSW